MPSRSRHHLLAHILLIGVVLVWGCTFPLVKSALEDTSPLLFNLLRMTLAALVLAAVNIEPSAASRSPSSALRHRRHLPRARLQFQTTGLALTTPSKSAFLTGLVVVIVPLLGLIPRVAPPSPRPNAIVLLGAVIAFAGLILLTSPPAPALSPLRNAPWRGAHPALRRRLRRAPADPRPRRSAALRARLGTLQIAFAALFMLLALPLGGRRVPPHPHRHPRPGHHRAARHCRRFHHPELGPAAPAPTHTALILTLEPVFASLTSLLFFHERFGPREISAPPSSSPASSSPNSAAPPRSPPTPPPDPPGTVDLRNRLPLCTSLSAKNRCNLRKKSVSCANSPLPAFHLGEPLANTLSFFSGR